jgi:imidazolonepropionase-like amidohydrolase
MLFCHNIRQGWLKRKLMVGMLGVIVAGIILLTDMRSPNNFAQAEETAKTCEVIKSQILIKNAHIFGYKPGNSDSAKLPELTDKMNILIVNKQIKEISKAPLNFIPTPNCANQDYTELPAKSINNTIHAAENQVLMPGLIDAHYHIMMATLSQLNALNADIGYFHHLAGKSASDVLMGGFTTVRDMGGPAFGLKRAIDEGLIVGPRIFPSGGFISQTGGHGDFGDPSDVPKAPGAPLSYLEQIGLTAIADSPDQVRLRTREQLRQGASQIKLMAGGGVISNYDPLDVTQYTKDEIVAAVQAAENWGTYVTVHAYTDKAIRQAVDAGVKCIEHGQLMTKDTAKLLAEKNIWLSLQPFLKEEGSNQEEGPNQEKLEEVMKGTTNAYKWAKEYGIKTAFGTDALSATEGASRQGVDLAKLATLYKDEDKKERLYTNAEILKMATEDNAELLELSGKRNPYYPGKLGIVQEGALADLLLVNGNPLQDINIIAKPAENFLVIIKDGKIYKNKTQPVEVSTPLH